MYRDQQEGMDIICKVPTYLHKYIGLAKLTEQETQFKYFRIFGMMSSHLAWKQIRRIKMSCRTFRRRTLYIGTGTEVGGEWGWSGRGLQLNY